MELRDYVEIVSRYKKFFVGAIVITTALVALMTARQPTRHEGSLTVTAFQDVPTQIQGASAYQFDSFYTLQAAGLYADHIKGRFADPAFVASVFTEADAPLPAKRLTRLGRVFFAKKQEPSQVQTVFDDADEVRVKAVLTSAGAQLAQELAELQASGALTSMRLTVGEPVVLSYRGSVLAASVVAAAASALMALALIFFWDFARPKK